MKRTICAVFMAALVFLGGCISPEKQNIGPSPAETTIDTKPSPEIGDVVDTAKTLSCEELTQDALKLRNLYPEIISIGVIGKSVEGRDIMLLRLGKGTKKLLLLGTHHAREYITSTFLIKTVDDYAKAYSANEKLGKYDIRALLDQTTVYIVPMVNPDGVNLVQNGVDAVKNPEKVKQMRMLKDSYEEWKANINGVDLNRQYPCHWDEKESNTDVPSSEMYKGKSPASEPEVQAVIKLCKENDFALAASFHTKGEVIYWADSGTDDSIAADDSIAETLAGVTGYKLMPVSEDPAVYGAGFENWFRQDFLSPAFCIELTPTGNGSAPHDDSQFSKLVWDKTKYLCAEIIVQALK